MELRINRVRINRSRSVLTEVDGQMEEDSWGRKKQRSSRTGRTFMLSVVDPEQSNGNEG